MADSGILSTSDGGSVDDTDAPVTRAPAAVHVKTGGLATLAYQIDDASLITDTAKVSIKIDRIDVRSAIQRLASG